MTEVSNNAWPLAGYAPGNYLCICRDCVGQFEGDKRAFRCIECAAKAVNLSLRLSHSTHPKEAEVTVTEEMVADTRIDIVTLSRGLWHPSNDQVREILVAALSRKG